MAHINHMRIIDHLSTLNVRDVFNNSSPNSFGVFCGRQQQRNLIGLYEISRVLGRMGIIILHNEPIFESELVQVYDLNGSTQSRNDINMYIANQISSNGTRVSFYDPLYGLPQREILDVLTPGSSNTFESNRLRSIISDYLSIMDFLFQINPSVSGNYPYTLDLLYELTSMPYKTLQSEVLSHLPDNLKMSISGRLSAEGSQQIAYQAVLSFSQSLNGFLWTKRDFRAHTKLSIVEAAKTKQLISIYLPESRSDILEYIATELQYLNSINIPYLVIENGLNLNASQKLKNIFFSEHSSLPHYTGVIAENTSNIIDQSNSTNDLAALFGQTQELYVFSCSSTMAAQPFSDGIGNYYRKVEDQHYDYHREPFHIFSSHSQGNLKREISQKMIDPEELTNMGNGCLLYGKNYPIPVLIDNFMF